MHIMKKSTDTSVMMMFSFSVSCITQILGKVIMLTAISLEIVIFWFLCIRLIKNNNVGSDICLASNWRDAIIWNIDGLNYWRYAIKYDIVDNTYLTADWPPRRARDIVSWWLATLDLSTTWPHALINWMISAVNTERTFPPMTHTLTQKLWITILNVQSKEKNWIQSWF